LFWWGRRCHLPCQLGFEGVDLGQHRRQFLLQVFLGVLVILVGEFTDAVLELEVAQVLVDGGLALI
jgi:hypothetical protein